MKYLPWILLIVAVASAVLFWTRSVKPEIALLEQQKKGQQAIIDRMNEELTLLERSGQAIRHRMAQDSVKNSERLKAKEIEILKLKRKLNNVSFKDYTTDRLDSLRDVLYSSGR